MGVCQMSRLIDPKIKYLHISSSARDMYEISPDFYSIQGNIVIANLAQARLLSEKINAKRRSDGRTDFTTPGIINAAALLHELFHFLIEKYEETQNPGVIDRALKTIKAKTGSSYDTLLLQFIEQFPPKPVLLGQQTAIQYLQSRTGLKHNSEIVLEEILLLYFENINPALTSIKELFDDSKLRETPEYQLTIEVSRKFFKDEIPFGEKGLSLFEFLEMPLLAHPNNIDLQLKYILDTWGIELVDILKGRILSGTDLIYEDAKLFVTHGEKGGTPGIPEYKSLSLKEINFLREQLARGQAITGIDELSYSYYFEPEQFTEDLDWMPKVVMIAKNIFVWLDQLSKKYERPIKTLDQIPDRELDILAEYNFNALWLIGVWERSSASKKIKQFCGNHDAVASAYSLYDYEIAEALGGWTSFENLKYRCQMRGIRMASDMVPNHTGIYSKCLMEHPDYFVQSPIPPYPGYSFTGPDLSENPDFQIRIEDKYYSKSDAAVVFELREMKTGRVRYIYHGNDGTNMPWNDTAQFNLLMPEVREYLVHQIKRVASMFPIIRFDAAMTLTNKHYQRLWYPQPGLGGAIPSRSDYGMTRETYNTFMPTEFWRDVVDIMTADMPNTLLLAEAFWLMEGYFVRSLGMHRVYNSAFMHMFMKEENFGFKKLIKDTLEYNPEILKRYVNFMSNPDEETAINQFGKGDKYFGVCAMLLTLPGLPMFAHGQIEGFTEKYGMEYQRAYYNEIPDEYLIDRHKREVFPLIKKRYLFSEVKNFWLYDFITPNGDVNDNVVAFTNGTFNEQALVVYNNSYEQVEGNIQFATGRIKGDLQSSENPEFEYTSIAQALQCEGKSNVFLIGYESSKGLEYLFSASELQSSGYSCWLNGYEYKVFHSFREMVDFDGSLNALCDELQGNGIPSVEEALWERKSRGLHEQLSQLLSYHTISDLKTLVFNTNDNDVIDSSNQEMHSILHAFSLTLDELHNVYPHIHSKSESISLLVSDLDSFRVLNKKLEQMVLKRQIKDKHTLLEGLFTSDGDEVYRDLSIVFLLINRVFGAIKPSAEDTLATVYRKLHISKQVWQSLIRLSSDYYIVKDEFDLLEILIAESLRVVKVYPLPDIDSVAISHKGRKSLSATYIKNLLDIPEIKVLLGYNKYHDIVYFNQEKFELLIKWNLILSLFDNCKMEIVANGSNKKTASIKKFVSSKKLTDVFIANTSWANELIDVSRNTGFQIQELKNSIDALAVNPDKAKKETKKQKSLDKAEKAKVKTKKPEKKTTDDGKLKKKITGKKVNKTTNG